MAKRKTVFIEGERELTRTLDTFETRTRNRFLRNASKRGAEIVKADYLSRIPVNYGAWRDSVVVRAPRGLKGRPIGKAVIIDREKLLTNYIARYGRPPNPYKEDGRWMFYPAVWEYGSHDGVTPETMYMRKALYENAQKVFRAFVSELKKSVRRVRSNIRMREDIHNLVTNEELDAHEVKTAE